MNLGFLRRLLNKSSPAAPPELAGRRREVLCVWTNPALLKKNPMEDATIFTGSVPQHVKEHGGIYGADGIYYRDRRLPFLVADQGAVTPTTTQKNIWTNGAASPTILPANYWTVGKTVCLTAFLNLTTGTAGNSVFAMAYGAADAPTCVVTTRTAAKIASVGPFGVFMQGYATCRTTGTGGTLSMMGFVYPSLDVFLSTVQPMPFPNNAATVVSTIDTTVGTNSLFFEYQTSAGTDSILATTIIMEAMN